MINQESLKKLDMTQLRAINSAVVAELNTRNAERARERLSKFNRGDKARFLSPRGWITVVIDRINTKTVSATQLDDDGKRTFQTWRVGATALSRIS